MNPRQRRHRLAAAAVVGFAAGAVVGTALPDSTGVYATGTWATVFTTGLLTSVACAAAMVVKLAIEGHRRRQNRPAVRQPRSNVIVLADRRERVGA